MKLSLIRYAGSRSQIGYVSRKGETMLMVRQQDLSFYTIKSYEIKIEEALAVGDQLLEFEEAK